MDFLFLGLLHCANTTKIANITSGLCGWLLLCKHFFEVSACLGLVLSCVRPVVAVSAPLAIMVSAN